MANTVSKLFSNGTLMVTGVFDEVSLSPTFQILAVAGGGGGGNRGTYGTGGGAGGLVIQNQNLTAGSYTITVGAAGAAGASATNGANTTIVGSGINIVAIGGGHGAVGGSVQGASGGSGGGSSCGTCPKAGGAALQPTSASGGFGNPGGAGELCFGSSSGGGAGGAGKSGCYGQKYVTGGAGYLSSITGTPTYYANGGPGAGASCSTITATSMGGGGAGNQVGANGGVIITYKSKTPLAIGGTITSYICSVYGANVQVHTFTSNGTFTIPNNLPLQKTYSNGTLQTLLFDEVTNNLNIYERGSLSFIGSSKTYLSTSSTQILPANGNFTIQAWVCPTASYSDDSSIFSQGNTGANRLNFFIQANTSKPCIQFGGTPYYTSTASPTIPIGTWTHMAVTSNGSSFSFYVNGVLGNTFNVALAPSNNLAYIGDNWDHSTYQFTGYISDLKVSKTSNAAITVPSRPLTSDANTILLLQTPYINNVNTFFDSGPNNITIINNNNVKSVSEQPFNPNRYWSVLYTGASSYNTFTTYTDVPFSLIQTNDFTVEFWINPSSFTNQTYAGMFDNRTSNGDTYGFGLYFHSPDLVLIIAGTSYTTAISGSGLAIGTWSHVAVVRYGTAMTVYINGVAKITTTNSTNFYNALWYLGQTFNGDNYNGYMSNFRLTIGTALYTSGFVPPTSALKHINIYTQVLTLQSSTFIDNATGYTITQNGTGIVVSNKIPFSSFDFAGTGVSVSKKYSNGALQIVGTFDEVTI